MTELTRYGDPGNMAGLPGPPHEPPDELAGAPRARLAVLLLAAVGAAFVVALLADLYLYLGRSGVGPYFTAERVLAAAFALLWGAAYLLQRRGRAAQAGIAMASLLLGANVVLLARSGPLAPAATALVLPVIVAGLFGAPAAALGAGGAAALAYLALNLRADPAYLQNVLAGGPAAQTLFVYASLALVAVMAWVFAQTTRRALAQNVALSQALTIQREDLMGRLAVQTRHLQATIQVARAIVGDRDLDHLLEDTVRLLRDIFGYYHVQVFLIDEAEGFAVLRQSTGEAGRHLLERGHRLPVGSLSVIGQATATGQPIVARDTDTDAVHRRNELLPDTRSEMALPLSVGDRLIGALDLQSVEPDAFGDEVIPTLHALADQIAIAIENARLFRQAEDTLREMRELNHETVRRTWAEFLADTTEAERRQIVGPEPPALRQQRSQVLQRMLSSGATIVSSGADGQPAMLAAPVRVRGEVVGVLGVEPDAHREWTQDDVLLLQGIAERTALAIENARLFMQAQRAAERERMIGSIEERLQRAPNLSLLLESAARELAEALGTDNVYAELSVEQPLARPRRSAGPAPALDAPQRALTEEVRAEG